VLRVKVLPEEAAVIEQHAGAAELSVSAYLRCVGAGLQPRAVVDHAQVHELLRVNGDLGRLGGLLKLWLTDDAKLDAYPRRQTVAAIRSALQAIEQSQAEVQAVVRRVLRQGSP
jgi:hypothetical protein